MFAGLIPGGGQVSSCVPPPPCGEASEKSEANLRAGGGTSVRVARCIEAHTPTRLASLRSLRWPPLKGEAGFV